jgi:lipopolysaccharide export system permease protein
VKILSRYLLREHLGPFTFALSAMTGLMLLNQVARQFANLIGKGLSWGVIGSVFGLSLPFILAMTVPMAVLVAALHAFSRMGADSEITALKASGVNLSRLVRPALIAASIVGALEFVFLDQVLPRTNHRLASLLIDIARKKPTFELREQAVNEVVQNQLFLRAGRIDQAADRMKNVVIYDLANPTRRRTIYADSGYIRYNRDKTDLYMTLFHGYIHDYDRLQSQTFRRIFFGTDLIKVSGVSNRLERTANNDFRGDREMSMCEMENVVRADMRAVAQASKEWRSQLKRDALTLVGLTPPPNDTSPPPVNRFSLTTIYCHLLSRVKASLVPPALRAEPVARRTRTPGGGGQAAAPAAAPAQASRLAPDRSATSLRAQQASIAMRQSAARQHATTFMVEIHKKWSLAVSCVVFVLIGAPVALRFPRGGIGLVIGASVAIFGFYYIGLIGGETLADRRFISPFWGMWMPNVVMALVGLALFRRLGRETATGRGGGLFAARRSRRRLQAGSPA